MVGGDGRSAAHPGGLVPHRSSGVLSKCVRFLFTLIGGYPFCDLDQFSM